MRRYFSDGNVKGEARRGAGKKGGAIVSLGRLEGNSRFHGKNELEGIDLGFDLRFPQGRFDVFEKAAADYPGGSEEQRQNRDKLQAIMTRHGFETFAHEGWHFDRKGWQDNAPLDISFEKLLTR